MRSSNYTTARLLAGSLLSSRALSGAMAMAAAPRPDCRLLTMGIVLAGAALLAPSSARARDTDAACVFINGACDLSTPIVNGDNGPSAPGDQEASGNPGTPGIPGESIIADLESPPSSVTLPLQSYNSISPVNAVTVGGKGGDGSDADAYGSIVTKRYGGNGASGQSGGTITLTVGPRLSGQAFLGSDGSTTSGMTLISLGGQGGSGGSASFEVGQAGNGLSGKGGDGGSITATIAGSWTSEPGAGLFATSQGGQGGGGNKNTDKFNSPQGVDAASGGAGNTVNVTVNGTVAGKTYGAFIASIGGDGGTGGSSYNFSGRSGGSGGDGGAAGNVVATLGTGGIAIADGSGAAFYAASLGGVGGTGGASNNAGTGGVGGNAGSVAATINGIVSTAGSADTYGVLVQSLGGAGGNGGRSGAWFNPVSGSGNTGGKASTVSISGSGATISTGNATSFSDNSSAVVAQSIGGGGGVGPNSNGWFAVGGNGGSASDGAQAGASFSDTNITTYGFNAQGILVQSIGGGGGKGGDSGTANIKLINGLVVGMAVGGTGGGGGAAADANGALLGSSRVQTMNKHSAGLQIQSIGGGGGDGGAAYGKVASLFYGASISVGGSGGAGGNGGTVNAARTENNSGRILTSDSDSVGMLAQSIGGGGGNGGASVAKSIVKAKGDGEFPSQSLAMATGGSGGIAGSAGAVYLQNSGFVATTGGNSDGMQAQAIGGGGGNAGDASASSSAGGGGLNLSAAIAVGGSGGAAGNGGNVEARNNGLILATGESAVAMRVQSIGGGGGNSGDGDAKSSTDADKSLSVSVGGGGDAGGAGAGFNVTVGNSGALLTIGDGGHGILAQTVGGGGGNAGGGAASSSGTLQLGIQVGGAGGNAGDTYYTGAVNAANSGTIVTYGADANGILAQSIGGGGGTGGKAATSVDTPKSSGDGGNGTQAGKKSGIAAIEANFVAKGTAAVNDYKTVSGALGTINGLLADASSVRPADAANTGDALDQTAASGGKGDDSNKAKSINVNVAVGGTGGRGGSSGFITVSNSGTIATMGKMSDAILAQSIGGGGGKAGAASTASSADIAGQVAVGGVGGSGGNGGAPTVVNTGAVYTIGALSAGIVAQSVGGGGGIGGASVTTATNATSSSSAASADKTVSLGISVGGNGGSGGNGESVAISSSGAIETRGHDAIGIIAQSIGGGGGIVKTLATDLDNGGGSASSSSSKDFAINFKFGGTQGTLGNSGSAHVTTTAGGSIVTRGDNAYGILAQSVAGGGGLALGGKPVGSSAGDFFGDGVKVGSVMSADSGDDDTVRVTVGDNITTSGKGAIGVVAQSVGGGGGIAGDTGWTQQLLTMGGSPGHVGSGGAVALTLNTGARISTTGDNTPAVFLQSIGGGGGRVTNKNGAFTGTAGGIGQGGRIDAMINGTIRTTGYASIGVFAQSQGDASSNAPIAVTVGGNGNISVGSTSVGTAPNGTSAAIYVDSGGRTSSTPNVVTNNGVVQAFSSDGKGVAVYSNGGYTKVFNTGLMAGNILLQNGGGQGCFTNSSTGSFVSGDAISVGPCGVSNAGAITIGGSAATSKTTLTGNFVQQAGGTLTIDADFRSGKSDRLEVSGTAVLGGTVHVRPISVSNKLVTVLTAAGGVTMDPQLATTDDATLYDFRTQVKGNEVQLSAKAKFIEAAASLGQGRRAVASNLQALFDGGASLDAGFNALAAVKSTAEFDRSLDAISGHALGAIGAFRVQSSRSFAGNLYGGCDRTDLTNRAIDGSHCVWARAFGTDAVQDASADVQGYKAKSWGLQLGGRTEISDNWSLTGAIAYQNTRLRDTGSVVNGDGLLAGVGVAYENGPFAMSAAIDIGKGWYSSKRQIVIGTLADTATGKPGEWAAGLHAHAAYTVWIGSSVYVKPFADAHLIHVESKAFAESGLSPFNLDVAKESNTSLIGAAGVEIGVNVPLKGGASIRPFASAAVELNSTDSWTTNARLASQVGDRFQVATAVPDKLGRFAVGLELKGNKNVDFSLQYAPEFGSGYTAHTGLAKLSIRF